MTRWGGAVLRGTTTARRNDLGGWERESSSELGHPLWQNLVAGTQRQQARGEVGGASGRVREHQGIAMELVDVQEAPNDGQSRLFVWRPSVVAAQGGIIVDGAAQRPLASEDRSGRSSLLTRGSRRSWSAGSGSDWVGQWWHARQTWWQLFLAPLLHEALKPAYSFSLPTCISSYEEHLFFWQCGLIRFQ
jgi:hypothetical protein